MRFECALYISRPVVRVLAVGRRSSTQREATYAFMQIQVVKFELKSERGTSFPQRVPTWGLLRRRRAAGGPPERDVDTPRCRRPLSRDHVSAYIRTHVSHINTSIVFILLRLDRRCRCSFLDYSTWGSLSYNVVCSLSIGKLVCAASTHSSVKLCEIRSLLPHSLRRHPPVA
ncbi:hypothetical protein EVAR_51592_1 [Eumeta japonica]|uniref:Uncharacterized protein n=1 Tax=Eumeta variegata TaxID=151549 RepID=A0A4C1YK05_EUMVA|nr:hypothetical protein EVAR_51592_1 [Eumeta japonica]